MSSYTRELSRLRHQFDQLAKSVQSTVTRINNNKQRAYLEHCIDKLIAEGIPLDRDEEIERLLNFRDEDIKDEIDFIKRHHNNRTYDLLGPSRT
jgi:hypothetical protein